MPPPVAPDPFPLLAQLQATVLALGDRVRHLEDEVRELRTAPAGNKVGAKRAHAPVAADEETPLEAHKATERTRIVSALERCGWNRIEAAKALKIPRRTLYRRLKEYGIQ